MCNPSVAKMDPLYLANRGGALVGFWKKIPPRRMTKMVPEMESP